MKTVKEILEAYNDNYLSKRDPRFGAKFPPEKDIPNVINLRRKAIRVFPDGQKIALYYAPQIDRYVSIPYGPGTQASAVQLSEAKAPEFDDDVTDAEKEAYLKKRKISSSDIRKQLSIGHIAKISGPGAAAKESLKRYKPGSGEGAKTAGELTTLGVMAAGRGIKNLIGKVREKLSNKTSTKKSPTKTKTKSTSAPSSALSTSAAKKVNFKGISSGVTSKDYKALNNAISAALKSPTGRAKAKPVKESFKENLKKARKEKQLNEIAPLVGAIAAGARIAGPAIARFVTTRAAPAVATVARSAGSKVKSIAGKIKGKTPKGKTPKNKKSGFGAKITTDAGASELINKALGGDSSQSSSGSSQSAWDAAKEAVPKSTSTAQFGNIQPKISSGDEKNVYSNPEYQFGGRRKDTRVQESTNFEKIKTIVENNIKTDQISFGDNSITINNRIAKKLINLYESLNKDNKKRFESTINEDANLFKKLINFAIRQ